MLLGFLDPDPDLLVRDADRDLDPTIIKQKSKKNPDYRTVS